MATQANHYQFTGSGIDGAVDTAGFIGRPVIAIIVDGQKVAGAELTETDRGLEVTAIIEQVPDSHTVTLTLLLPRVNLDKEELIFAGLALLTTARTSIGGPDLVTGAVQGYALRPVGGTAMVTVTTT